MKKYLLNSKFNFTYSLKSPLVNCIHTTSNDTQLEKQIVNNSIDKNNSGINLKKKFFKDFYFNTSEFYNFDIFFTLLANTFRPQTRYSVVFRVCFGNDAAFKMLGKQIGFYIKDFSEKSAIDSFKLLHDNICFRIESSMLNYNYSADNIISIQLIFYEVKYTDTVVIANNFTLNSLGDNKDLVDISSNMANVGYNKLIPLTMDINEYPNRLDVKQNNNTTEVFFDGKWVDFTSKINEKRNLLNKGEIELKNILMFSDSKNKFIFSLDKSVIDNNISHMIDVYTPDGSECLNIVDKQTSNTSFQRIIGNISNTIDNKQIISSSTIKVNLDLVKQTKTSRSLTNLTKNDPFIGTLDTETYLNSDSNESKVYAIGFYTKLHGAKTFYIDKDLDSDKLIIECIDSLLVKKYDKYTFYVHNLARFDVVFILKTLLKANSNNNKYILDVICRDNLILKLGITTKINKISYNIKLVDSYNILSNSLKELCETFVTKETKDHFPYRFVTNNTLFYKDTKPVVSFYDNIKPEVYDSIENDNWDTKEETIKYLNKDLISLFQVMDTFSDYIYTKYNVQVSNSLTISSLAMKIFLKRYYSNNIPLINKRSLYEDIKQSYFGGITEVYKPYGENLFYYDVNSLYPYAALNDMPSNKCVYENNINMKIGDMINCFGFFYCHIKTNGLYLGLLPVRTNSGIIMPNGEWQGWYFSEELKFAEKNGYTIKVFKGYHFEKEFNVFDKYVNHFYDIKATTTSKVEKASAKSLLNNLLGRFGLNINRPTTELFNLDKLNEVLQTKDVSNIISIDNSYLVSYNNKVSKEICDQLKVDYKKTVLNNLKNKNETEASFKDVSIVIASAVTSYARIFMSKIKLDILKQKGSIYYSDTDSIITDKPLDPKLVGSELGKFKWEHFIKRAYFISSKTYCLILDQGGSIIKAKGVNDKTLSEDSFIKLFKGENITSKRLESIRDYSKGFVNVNIPKEIILNADAYRKRTKIFDNKNIWIDTLTLTYNQSIIPTPYNPPKEVISSQKKSYLKSFIIGIILSMSCVAYVLTLEEDSSLMILQEIKEDKEVKGDIDDINSKDNKGDDNSPDLYAETVSTTNKDLDPTTIDESVALPVSEVPQEKITLYQGFIDQIPQQDKTLYEGFVKQLSNIEKSLEKSKDLFIKDSLLNQTGTEESSSEQSSISPTYSTHSTNSISSSEQTNNTTLPSQETSPEKKFLTLASNNNNNTNIPDLESSSATPDHTVTTFSPNTLSYLDDEIKRNDHNIQSIDSVCKDEETKPSLIESLLEEKNYLLQQKANHLNGVLEQARNKPVNDTDVDKLCDDISHLLTDVEKLAEQSEMIKDRKLDSDQDNRDNK